MWRLFHLWVVGFVLPGYLAACAFLTLVAIAEGDLDPVPFAVVGVVLWSAMLLAGGLVVRGLSERIGWAAWASRSCGWLLLVAGSIPYVSVSFVTWPLLITALPLLAPQRRPRARVRS